MGSYVFGQSFEKKFRWEINSRKRVDRDDGRFLIVIVLYLKGWVFIKCFCGYTDDR